LLLELLLPPRKLLVLRHTRAAAGSATLSSRRGRLVAQLNAWPRSCSARAAAATSMLPLTVAPLYAQHTPMQVRSHAPCCLTQERGRGGRPFASSAGTGSPARNRGAGHLPTRTLSASSRRRALSCSCRASSLARSLSSPPCFPLSSTSWRLRASCSQAHTREGGGREAPTLTAAR